MPRSRRLTTTSQTCFRRPSAWTTRLVASSNTRWCEKMWSCPRYSNKSNRTANASTLPIGASQRQPWRKCSLSWPSSLTKTLINLNWSSVASPTWPALVLGGNQTGSHRLGRKTVSPRQGHNSRRQTILVTPMHRFKYAKWSTTFFPPNVNKRNNLWCQERRPLTTMILLSHNCQTLAGQKTITQTCIFNYVVFVLPC